MAFSDDMQKLLLAGAGVLAIGAEKSEEFIKELLKKGERAVNQDAIRNEELKHRKRNKEGVSPQTGPDRNQQEEKASEESFPGGNKNAGIK